MKLDEVKTKIKDYSKEDLIKIICEMYKNIPKKIKQINGIDSIFDLKNIVEKKVSKKVEMEIDAGSLQFEIDEFVENARQQYYFAPNRIISKNERSKWRFKVIDFYKQLLICGQKPENFEIVAKCLKNLYLILAYGCTRYTFSSTDTFRAIRVSQPDFFNQTINFFKKAYPIDKFIFECIELILDNEMDRETIPSELMDIFIKYLDIPDLKQKSIQMSVNKIVELTGKIDKSKNIFERNNFDIRESNNLLAELILRISIMLGETEAGIKKFIKYYIESNLEIKVYMLVRILFTYKKKDEILNVINYYSQKRKLRDELINLKKYIEEKNDMPQYM